MIAADIYRPAASDQVRRLLVNKDQCPCLLTWWSPCSRDRSPRFGRKREPTTMTMSWSIQPIVCKSTKNSWASCVMSKPLLSQTGNPRGCRCYGLVKKRNVARGSNEQLEAGVILTKIDGDTRGGATPFCRQITGKPIKFTGTLVKITDIETFHPGRMSGRISAWGICWHDRGFSRITLESSGA